MNIHLKTIPFLLLLTFFSACCPLTSINPLSNPNEATFDARLQGTWQAQTKDNPVYLHIGETENNKTQVVSIEHKRSAQLDVIYFLMFPTKINGNNFMNLNSVDIEFIGPSDEKTKDKQGYYFIRYDFQDNETFSISMIDEELISNAIQTGKLKGTINYKIFPGKKEDVLKIRKIECLQLSDSTENLINYLKTTDINKLFPQKDSIIFKRLVKGGIAEKGEAAMDMEALRKREEKEIITP